MKRHFDVLVLYYKWSHPAGVRGLKLLWHVAHGIWRWVAPRRGAWIETKSHDILPAQAQVAPRRGAWIETAAGGRRGDERRVAPRRGAWIETTTRRQ